MSNLWVYKLDGTIQCDKEARKIPLDEARAELSSLIGSNKIIGEKVGSRVVPEVCYFPTGGYNAFEITAEGWYILQHGFRGSEGFLRLEEGRVRSMSPEELNIGQLIGSLTSAQPHTVAQLVGHSLRVYKTGDGLTKDWRPERCNIELINDDTIVSIWFG
jgi:hypothetical protein